jgi:hypothetical protein
MSACEINQGCIDLSGTLLLDPVACTFDQDLAFEARHHIGHLVERALAHRSGDHGVVCASDEQRGLHDLRAVEWRGQFEVAVDVAIPVEPAAKAAALIGGGEYVDVGLG